MTDSKLEPETKLKQIQLSKYFLPIIGVLPAIWTTYISQNPTTEEKSTSRLALKLNFSWFLAYILLWSFSLQTTELLSFRLLYINGVLTTGYFLICFGLLFRIWQGKIPRLPRNKK